MCTVLASRSHVIRTVRAGPGDQKSAMSGGSAEDSPVRVICNPASGGGTYELEAIRAGLRDLKPDWVFTEGRGDAREAARGWRGGLLVVIGGDGTVNEVVDGLGIDGFPKDVTLALLPTGTGNDLAATLEIPADAGRAVEVFRMGRVRALDAARVRSREVGERFFVNTATGGAGAEASGTADDGGLKSRWGRLAYLRVSVGEIRTFEPRKVRLAVDGLRYEVCAVNLAVGNCRHAGGGWPAAPKANPEGGLLDLVVIEEAGLPELLALVPKVLAGMDYLGSEGVFLAQGREIRVESEPPVGLEFNADGELIGRGPAEFTVIPRALKVIVGPGYAP